MSVEDDELPDRDPEKRREVDLDKPRVRSPREREISLSRRVYRGQDTRLEDVLVDEDVAPQPGDWPPDRLRDPWGWEMWWRPIMRPGHVSSRWRAYRLVPVVWTCEHCGGAIADVKQRGRPPKFCSRACQQAAYRERTPRVTKCPL